MWNRNLRKIRSGAILAVVSCAVMPGQTACSLPIAISVLASAIVSFPAVAQSNQANHSAQSDSRNLEESEVKFEVLSIKSVEHGSNTQVQIQNPRPNGFTGTAYIIQWLAFAYGPPVPANQSQVWMMTEMRNARNGPVRYLHH